MNRSIFLFALAACSPMAYTHGVPNLAAVDGNVYRSGQITTQEGWAHVVELARGRHVHVIKLNFDNEGSDTLGIAAGAIVHDLAIQPEGDQDVIDDVRSVFRQPDPAKVDDAIALLRSARPDELWLVHCTHGQDRTGYVIGRYRVLVEHWTKDAAYKEMLAHDFHPELHGVREAWEQFHP